MKRLITPPPRVRDYLDNRDECGKGAIGSAGDTAKQSFIAQAGIAPPPTPRFMSVKNDNGAGRPEAIAPRRSSWRLYGNGAAKPSMRTWIPRMALATT